MSRYFPPPPPLPQQVKPFQRVPPAIFPPILGLLGLGIAWRRGGESFGAPAEAVELYLGAVTLVFLFSAMSYGLKLAKRPGVFGEDLRVLPGRAGLAALTMCVMLLAAVLVPHAPGAARWVLWAGVAGHTLVVALVALSLLWRPDEAAPMTPALHLVFVGFIVAPAAAVPLGMTALVGALAVYSLGMSLAICARTLPPVVTGREPPPLRPLHMIHLAPAALVASAAFLIGWDLFGQIVLGWASLLFALLLVRIRWITEAGFSGFWSAFTFPTASYAGAWFLAYDTLGGPLARIAGGLVLVLATMIIPPIAVRILQMWAKGTLAAKTNAAIA